MFMLILLDGLSLFIPKWPWSAYYSSITCSCETKMVCYGIAKVKYIPVVLCGLYKYVLGDKIMHKVGMEVET